MEVRVKLKRWGSYSEGETLDIPNRSTALACIKAGAVEAINAKKLNEPVEVAETEAVEVETVAETVTEEVTEETETASEEVLETKVKEKK